jgi:transcription termination factor NusB
MWSKTQRYEVCAGIYQTLFRMGFSQSLESPELFFALFDGLEDEIDKNLEKSVAVIMKRYQDLQQEVEDMIYPLLKDPQKTNTLHLALFYSYYLERTDGITLDEATRKNLINKYLGLLEDFGDKQGTGFVHAILWKIGQGPESEEG